MALIMFSKPSESLFLVCSKLWQFLMLQTILIWLELLTLFNNQLIFLYYYTKKHKMSVVFVCFSNIKFELALEYSENKTKRQEEFLYWTVVFGSDVINLNRFNCSKHSMHKQAHCSTLTIGSYCLGITEQTWNETVLSSKFYKEAFCCLEPYMI